MKFCFLRFFVIIQLFLWCKSIFALDEILPIGQIRDIGAESSIQPQIEQAHEKVEKAVGEGKGEIFAKELESKPGKQTAVSGEGAKKLLKEQVTSPQAQGLTAEFLPKLLKRKFDFSLNGYVAAEAMYDTRQVISAKYNEYVILPAPQRLDKTGLDINDKSQFNMLAIRGTLATMIKASDIWKAKMQAVIEGDFTGISDGTVGLFRLKKAFANFDWRHTALMLGQYYDPMVLDELYPEVISFGRGIVYDPFRYSPQIKLRHRFDRYEFVTALSKRFDHAASRRAAMPDLFGEFYAHVKKHLVGTGISYHTEVPRLYTEVNVSSKELNVTGTQSTVNTYKTTESLSSIYPFAFAALDFNPFDVRMRLTYTQNGNVYYMIGNYGVSEVIKVTDRRLYVNMRAIAFWTDIIYKRLSRFEPAVFIGVTKNLGAGTNILRSYQNGFADNVADSGLVTQLQADAADVGIDYAFICAPRLRVKFGNLHLCAELEYTRAAFSNTIGSEDWEKNFGPTGKVVCSKPVNNFRLLFATFYDFDYSPFAKEEDYYEAREITK